MDASERQTSVDPDGVYLIAWNLKPKKFHWGVFIAVTEEAGALFHCANEDSDRKPWEFHERPNYVICSSVSFLAGVKVSRMYDFQERETLQGLRERLAQLDFVAETDNCQIWARKAIYLMADEGFVPLQPNMNNIMSIEAEAEQLAMACQAAGVRAINASNWYTP